MTDTPKTAFIADGRTDVPCMFCGTTDAVKMRKVYGLHLWMVATCNLCVDLVQSADHCDRQIWVVTAHGATYMMNRIEALENAARSMRKNVAGHEQQIGELESKLPDDPEDGKDCDGELEEDDHVVSVDGMATRPVSVKHPTAHGIFVRVEAYNYLAVKLNAWRSSQRIKVLFAGLGIGHGGEHNGWYARVPEGER